MYNSCRKGRGKRKTERCFRSENEEEEEKETFPFFIGDERKKGDLCKGNPRIPSLLCEGGGEKNRLVPEEEKKASQDTVDKSGRKNGKYTACYTAKRRREGETGQG